MLRRCRLSFACWLAVATGSQPALAQAHEARFLRELVELSSDTSETAGVAAVQHEVEERLAALGFAIRYLQPRPAGRESARLLVAERPGRQPQYVTLLVHADTVFPRSSGFVGGRVVGNRMIGPGVIDDKGGIVVALAALQRHLTAHPNPRFGLRVLVSPDEEGGSTGFVSHYEHFAADARAVLGFEPALPGGDIIDSRRGLRVYDIRVTGVQAHAGRDYTRGASACHELAFQVAALHALTDAKRDLSVNVNFVEGGAPGRAIVCGAARAELDLRFVDEASAEEASRRIAAILGSARVKADVGGATTRTTYRILESKPPVVASRGAQPLIAAHAAAVAAREGRRPRARRSGGTSDLNYFQRPDLVRLDGLGPVGDGMHTPGEYVLLPSLRSRAEAAAAVLAALERAPANGGK
jgi:glutamate carboxypeptidase